MLCQEYNTVVRFEPSPTMFFFAMLGGENLNMVPVYAALVLTFIDYDLTPLIT